MKRTYTIGLTIALLAAGGVRTAAAAPYFEDVPGAFGDQPCADDGCWTNYLRVTDIDVDGDLDALFVNYEGFFKQGNPEPFRIYQNDGEGVFTDVSDQAAGGFSARLRQIAVGDVDGDGDPDIYAPDGWGDPDRFLINDGTGVFVDEAEIRLPGVSSRAGAARFGDVDGDGDLDLLVADGYAQVTDQVAHLYFNDGAGVFTEAAVGALPTTKVGKDPDDFDLFDADRDWDLDLLINMHSGKSSLWINDGAGNFTDATDSLPAQPQGFHYGPAVCDVDGDGDLDVWTDNMGPDYSEQLIINDGTGVFTDETVMRVSGNVNGADDNGVACIDVDGDGDFDAAIMSLSNVERVLENDGRGNFTLIPMTFTMLKDPTLWFEFGDVDGDGRLDAITGQGEGSPASERLYLGTDMAPVDEDPPAILALEDPGFPIYSGDEPLVRFAVADNSVTDEGPRLQRALAKVTIAGESSEVPASFMGGDLFRVKLPSAPSGATVEYSVCAIDQAGNEGCAPGVPYEVVGDEDTDGGTETMNETGAPVTDTGGDTDGDTGAPTTGATPDTDGDTGAPPTTSDTGNGPGGDPITDTEGDSTGGATATDTGALDDDSGCGCSTDGRDQGPAALLLGLGVLFALPRRRR